MYDLSHMTVSGISQTPVWELEARHKKVEKILEKDNLKAMVFFSAASIFYLTGSAMYQTERPMAYIYNPGGKSIMLAPRLELEHAQDILQNCEVVCYPEYPGERHPMYFLRDILCSQNLDKAHIAADGAGYPPVCGYFGPSLTDICPEITLTFLPRMITELKIYKSDYEISLMKESARWGQYSHMLLQQYTRPGVSELEVSSKASADATSVMLKTLGPHFRLTGLDARGCYVGYRGQIGPHSYFPHSTTTNAIFKKGDTLVTGAGVSILGYNSELERVMFVGSPSKEQEKFYNLAVMAQDAAYSAIKPGKKCSDVDKEMMRFFKENNLMEYWRHHTGHSIGTGGHEAPFFDIGDDSIIEPNMCFTVEPGIYVEGLGGFRLSDTLVVTETGFELITYYTRDIEDLICGDI